MSFIGANPSPVTLGLTFSSERHRLQSGPLRLTGCAVSGKGGGSHNDESRPFIPCLSESLNVRVRSPFPRPPGFYDYSVKQNLQREHRPVRTHLGDDSTLDDLFAPPPRPRVSLVFFNILQVLIAIVFSSPALSHLVDLLQIPKGTILLILPICKSSFLY